ncbi:unnamed protein product [Trifolium pratense]|uniref:Uncharacterized protein n=1 Tax=Trifolium pratense TaxID=57577 RepID=A0ACB0KYI9_TRIPR|nr:unnamed protein product [Trifolium pratense]
MLSSENIALDEKTLEELQNAIAEENYAKAAEIRDTLKSLHKDSKTEVLGANNKFYNSFRNGDLATMQAMWAKRDEVCCVHPGLKEISGYDDVIESWNFKLSPHMKRRTLKSKELEIYSHGNFSQLANSLRRSVIISLPMTPPSIGKPYESCVQEQKDTRYFNLEGSLPRPSCFHADIWNI